MINKTSLKIVFILTITLSLVTMESCKREEPCCDASNPECPNYDPCYGKEHPSAKFDMAYANNLFPSPIYWPDSVFRGNGNLHFVSLEENLEVGHRWYVGSEIIEGVSAVTRRFEDVPRPATIEITHVIEYEPNLSCHPNDDGYDSVIQSFDLINRRSELLTIGTFRGIRGNETDSFEIIFKYVRYENPFIDDPTWIEAEFASTNQVINFDNQGDTLWGEGKTNGNERQYVIHENHQLYFEHHNSGYPYYGTGSVTDDGNITLTYTRDGEGADGTFITFKGRKIK